MNGVFFGGDDRIAMSVDMLLLSSLILLPRMSPVSSAAFDEQDQRNVAIKRISRIFERKILTKRVVREIKLLKHFNGHENVSVAVHQRT
jgi:serine/threonine protein kinase